MKKPLALRVIYESRNRSVKNRNTLIINQKDSNLFHYEKKWEFPMDKLKLGKMCN